jgi:hypothetical protein
MNNSYNLFLRNCHNGVPVEVTLASQNQRDGDFPIHLEGEYVRTNHSSTIMAYLRPDGPTGRLLIHFLRHSIISERQARYFDKDLFVAATNQSLSPGVIKALGWKPGEYYLGSGLYPILGDADFYTVSGRVGRSSFPHNEIEPKPIGFHNQPIRLFD